MIALIRRLRDSARDVRPSDWMLVAVEGVIVFVSLFAAFQLQEWAENRRESRQADRLVERLIEEAERGAATIATAISSSDGAVRDADEVAMALQAGQCPANEQLQAVFVIDFYPAITPDTSAYQELVGSSGLAIIDDPVARDAVSNYYSRLEYMQEQLVHFRSNPDVLDYGDPREMPRYRGLSEEGPVSPFDGINYDRGALCSDPEFAVRLFKGVRNQRIFQYFRGETLAAAMHMCRALDDQRPDCGDRFIMDEWTAETRAVIANRLAFLTGEAE